MFGCTYIFADFTPRCTNSREKCGLTPAQVFEAFSHHTVEMESDLDTEVSAFVQTIAAFLFAINGTEVSDLMDRARDGGGLLTNLPIGTYTMAEVLVAAAHKRSVRFRSRHHEHELPTGVRLIPFKPVYRNSDASERIEAVILDELRQQYPEPDNESGRAFEEAFFENLGNFFQEKDAKIQCDLIKARMRIEKKRTGLLPYMAFRLPDNEYEREFLLKSIRPVFNRFPDLVVMVLDDVFKTSDAEALSVLPYYVPMAPSNT